MKIVSTFACYNNTQDTANYPRSSTPYYSLIKADSAVIGAIHFLEHAVDEAFHARGVLSKSLKVVTLHEVEHLPCL